MMPIRVVLIDDHSDIHAAVSALLRTTTEISLVGQAYRGSDAVSLCGSTDPDLVLMDVVMPGVSGIEAARDLVAEFPQIKILALSSYRDYGSIRAMIDSGASGYVVKDAIAHDLIDTIRTVCQGYTIFSPGVTQTMLARPDGTRIDFSLTERELAVLRLMGEGQSDKQVAQVLSISKATVRFHLGNILLKIGVDTRSQALVVAAKHNLI
jgi:two-component system, NarL family, response regulator LiaR